MGVFQFHQQGARGQVGEVFPGELFQGRDQFLAVAFLHGLPVRAVFRAAGQVIGQQAEEGGNQGYKETDN